MSKRRVFFCSWSLVSRFQAHSFRSVGLWRTSDEKKWPICPTCQQIASALMYVYDCLCHFNIFKWIQASPQMKHQIKHIIQVPSSITKHHQTSNICAHPPCPWRRRRTAPDPSASNWHPPVPTVRPGRSALVAGMGQPWFQGHFPKRIWWVNGFSCGVNGKKSSHVMGIAWGTKNLRDG